jgi:peptidase M28-like protein
MQTIQRLCSFEGRYPGTDAERRAAGDLAAQLEAGGRRAKLESTYVHPQWSLVHAAHVAIAVAGSLVAIASPPAGFALVLFAAVSTYLDLNTRFYLLRRLFFRRASQNVVSRGRRTDAPARVVLCAHYDAARTGYVYGERSVRLAAGLSPRLRVVLGPMRVIFWSIALLVPVLGARMAGVDAGWLSIVQLLPTVALIVAGVLLLDIALSDIVPGANDNASGVAVAMALAATLDRDPPPNLDVWVLLTGAEECLGEGMREFVRAHRGDLDRDSTYFLAIDSVGFGRVHYETSEGLAVSYAMDPRLIALCEAIAAADREGEDRFRAAPIAHSFLTDALPPTLAGYSSIALIGASDKGLPPPSYHTLDDTPDRIQPESLVLFHDFALELVRQIDKDVGRRLERVI